MYLAHRFSKRAKELLASYDIQPPPTVVEVDIRGNVAARASLHILTSLFRRRKCYQAPADAVDQSFHLPQYPYTRKINWWIGRSPGPTFQQVTYKTDRTSWSEGKRCREVTSSRYLLGKFENKNVSNNVLLCIPPCILPTSQPLRSTLPLEDLRS